MSPFPSRCSAPMTSRIVRESTRVATRKLIRAGKFALIRPVMTSTLGRCVASTRCMPTARAICASRVTDSSTFCPLQHHQIGQLVDDDQDVGKRRRVLPSAPAGSSSKRLRGTCCSLPNLAVVLIDIADALRCKQFQPALHLEHGVSERVRRFPRIRDHRRQQVRNALIDAELDALRDPP